MKKTLAVIFAVSSLLAANQAFAGDTTELLDDGALEITPTVSLQNLHDGKPGFSSEIGVGYGVMDFLTASVGIGFSSDEALANAGAELNLGLLTTPLDTDMFDIDFMVDFTYDGGYTVTPAFEFNFDLDPDMSSWGLYVRLGLPVYSGEVAKADNAAETEIKSDLGIDFTVGSYLTLGDHQFVVEGGFVQSDVAENLGENTTGDAFVSLGYNVMITDSFELTTELAFAIPANDDDEFSAALTIGGIFGIPTKEIKE